MCSCVYMLVCACVCLHECVCLHVCACVCSCACACVWACVCISVCVCMSVCLYVCVYIYLCAWECVCVCFCVWLFSSLVTLRYNRRPRNLWHCECTETKVGQVFQRKPLCFILNAKHDGWEIAKPTHWVLSCVLFLYVILENTKHQYKQNNWVKISSLKLMYNVTFDFRRN